LHFHWLVLLSHQEVLPAEASPTPSSSTQDSIKIEQFSS
jgi:hypothetical protein